MSRLSVKLTAATLATLLGLGFAAGSSAAVTYESINVNDVTQTMSDGNVVTISDDNSDCWYGTAFSQNAVYKTDGSQAGSFIKFAFSTPVQDAIIYYAYLGRGDELKLSTDQGDTDFTTADLVVSHNGTIVGGQPAANLLASGLIQSATGGDASGAIELHFATAVNYINIAAAPSGAPGGNPGINLVGLDIAAAAVDPEPTPEPTPSETPTETLADTGIDTTTTLAFALLLLTVGATAVVRSKRH